MITEDQQTKTCYFLNLPFTCVAAELLVRSDVEHSTGRVVTAGSKVQSIGHEGDGVDIQLMPMESLITHSIPDIPQLCSRITGSYKR